MGSGSFLGLGKWLLAVPWESGVAQLPARLLFASLFWPAQHCQYCRPGNSWRNLARPPGLLESPQQSGHLQRGAGQSVPLGTRGRWHFIASV